MNPRFLPTAFVIAVTAIVPPSAHADVIASTDFSGRTVSGKTASNITWAVDGVQDPGDLTAVDEAPTNAAFTALFDSANAQGHFAPDKNTGNEGPWSVTIPLTLTETEITIVDVELDWQNFNNAGAFQGPTAGRKVDWTVTVTGSTSGQVGTEMVQVDGVSGVETLTFTSPLTLTDAETWDVKILAVGGEPTGNNTGLDGVTINGTVGGDMDPPLIATLVPADDDPQVAIGANLVATFNEDIAAGTGDITIRRVDNDNVVESFDVTTAPSAQLTIAGTTVTINPTSDLPGDTALYVEIAATAIDDLAGNSFAGIADKTTWNFTTDASGPVALTYSNNGATGVPIGAGLVIGFDEDVQVGSGNVVVKRLSDDAVLATIDVTTGNVVIGGSTATVFPAAPLPANTEIYVEIDAGAIEDLIGNDFAGISGSGTWSFITASAANLLAHYTFDVDGGGTTPDAVGSSFATLGNRVQINTAGGVSLAGAGALEMLGAGVTPGPGDGAVTNNNFAWADDARTVTFWWKARTPNVDEPDGTFVSFGESVSGAAGNGLRFDIKEQGASGTSLRVEIQGTGQNTTPAIDDGAWHFIAVVVPNNATFADIAWFVDGSATDLNPSANTLDIITGTGPLVFGDSILTFGGDTRVPDGFLDDVQVYGSVLDQTQLTFLFNNPGCVVGESCGGAGPVLLADWAALQGVTGADAFPTADSDLDTVALLLEFAFGMDPAASDNTALTVTNGSTFTPGTPRVLDHPPSGGSLVGFQFVRRKDHAVSGLTYTPMFVDNAGAFYEDPAAAAPIVVSDAGGDYEVVEVRFPVFDSLGRKADSLLGMVEVTQD